KGVHTLTEEVEEDAVEELIVRLWRVIEEAPSGDLTSLLAPPRGPGEIGWLGPYRVLRGLRAGGRGARFGAPAPQLCRRVALKVLKPGIATNEVSRQRFLREGKAIAALSHDHIITIYQVNEDRGVSYLAMQFLEGTSVEALLKKAGRLTPAQAV